MAKRSDGAKMDSLEILTKLKQSVHNARYCNMTPEYRELALETELERIDHLVDKLLEERLK